MGLTVPWFWWVNLRTNGELMRVLALLREVLNKLGGVAARKKAPSTFQTLEHPEANGPQTGEPVGGTEARP